MEQITITEKKGANYVLLEIVGNLNLYTYTDFQAKIIQHIKDSELVLDLSQVSAISSSGLGALMVGYEDGESSGHKLYIMNPSVTAKMAIESTGFAEYFPVIHSLTEVL
ncbi:MAG: STAS domain-containing protein [Spirochaetales bacterium]